MAIVRNKGDQLLDGGRQIGMLVILVIILRITRNVKAKQGALTKSRQELIVVGSK